MVPTLTQIGRATNLYASYQAMPSLHTCKQTRPLHTTTLLFDSNTQHGRELYDQIMVSYYDAFRNNPPRILISCGYYTKHINLLSLKEILQNAEIEFIYFDEKEKDNNIYLSIGFKIHDKELLKKIFDKEKLLSNNNVSNFINIFVYI